MYRDDSGPLRYGMTVAIKAPSAKERYVVALHKLEISEREFDQF